MLCDWSTRQPICFAGSMIFYTLNSNLKCGPSRQVRIGSFRWTRIFPLRKPFTKRYFQKRAISFKRWHHLIDVQTLGLQLSPEIPAKQSPLYFSNKSIADTVWYPPLQSNRTYFLTWQRQITSKLGQQVLWSLATISKFSLLYIC